MNFVYSIIVNYHFPVDRLEVYILYLKLAELPKAQGGKCPVAPLGCVTDFYVSVIEVADSKSDLGLHDRALVSKL